MCEALGASWRWKSPGAGSGWWSHGCECPWKPPSSVVRLVRSSFLHFRQNKVGRSHTCCSQGCSPRRPQDSGHADAPMAGA